MTQLHPLISPERTPPETDDEKIPVAIWGGHLITDGHFCKPVPEGGCHMCGRTGVQLQEYTMGYPLCGDCEDAERACYQRDGISYDREQGWRQRREAVSPSPISWLWRLWRCIWARRAKDKQ